jgi:hypothetical protein
LFAMIIALNIIVNVIIFISSTQYDMYTRL